MVTKTEHGTVCGICQKDVIFVKKERKLTIAEIFAKKVSELYSLEEERKLSNSERTRMYERRFCLIEFAISLARDTGGFIEKKIEILNKKQITFTCIFSDNSILKWRGANPYDYNVDHPQCLPPLRYKWYANSK